MSTKKKKKKRRTKPQGPNEQTGPYDETRSRERPEKSKCTRDDNEQPRPVVPKLI